MEIWKDIKGYEGLYQVSNLGRVKSLERHVVHNYGGLRKVTERLLKPVKGVNGYIVVTLFVDNIRSQVKIHRLVASAFIENTENKPQINHKNGVKSDNRVENLEWCTQTENNSHALDKGLRKMPTGKSHHWYGRSIKGSESHIAKKVINTDSGEIYGCAKEAAKKVPFCYSYFSGMLNGRFKNQTSFRYL